MVSGTKLIQGSGAQWRWRRVINEYALAGVVIYGFVSVIGAPHNDRFLAGFVLF